MIDVTVEDIERIGYFLKTSESNYDVYLYKGEDHDLEWLNYIVGRADLTLINDTSQVTISHSATRYQTNPLQYFEQFETQTA